MEVLLTKDYVYSLLEEKRISKADFARQIGVQRTNLDALLRADKKDINIVIRMADALGMSLPEFIGLEQSSFKIQGYVKVGKHLREISSEEDWFNAELESGVCSIPYYNSSEAANINIEKFLTAALKRDDDCSMMGRVKGETVFTIAITNEYITDERNITVKGGRLIIVSVLSSTKGMTTTKYSTIESEGDFGYMFEEIKNTLAFKELEAEMK